MMRVAYLIVLTLTVVANGDHIPIFKLDDLTLGASSFPQLIRSAKDLGAFAVSHTTHSDEHHRALNNIRDVAPDCFQDDKSIHYASLTENVFRLTSATSSNDDSTGHPKCVKDSLGVIEKTFDLVGGKIFDAIANIHGKTPEFHHGKDKVESLHSAPYLDHVHVYRNKGLSDDDADDVAPVHRDNGLFLLLTPSPDDPLVVQDKSGNLLDTGKGDVIVMFGRAMEEWLFQESKGHSSFRAAPHAVPRVNKDRVVFARMFVAPPDAVPNRNEPR